MHRSGVPIVAIASTSAKKGDGARASSSGAPQGGLRRGDDHEVLERQGEVPGIARTAWQCSFRTAILWSSRA